MAKIFQEIKSLNLPEIEAELLELWDEEKTFAASVAARDGGPSFTFYEGPPTANGRPGIHHVLGRTIKDTFCRYKTLKGYRVERKGGWDTHGLPVEIEVEKELGLDGRQQVEAYGIEAFNLACRESVSRYKRDWDELTRRIAFWVDLENPYVTFENTYIESVWWLIKEIHRRDLLYKGHKIQWYSPGSGTVLSSHEVSLGYKEVSDPSIYVRFRSTDEEHTSLLAWTTTPWTLISNVALVVGADIDYVTVKCGAERLVLAEARLDILDDDYTVIERHKGRDLIGRSYEPLYLVEGTDYPEHAWRVYEAEYVTVDDGTGIVHIAPAFGAEDFEIGQRERLPMVNPVASDGVFRDEAPLVAGDWFKDADRQIIRDLKDRGLLFKRREHVHSYPHDWRKGTPLMSYPVESWFIRTTAVKDRLVALNKTVQWHPNAIRDGRFGNWLENNVDWALSRMRYWGTPLPIWVSDKPGSSYYEVIGSLAELREKCGKSLPDGDSIDLHRPFVDEFTWPAPEGGTMRRVPDVLDVWFDSGAMPFAQWHYPFENKQAFERNFPADFICEGIDQTRGWFYTLHAIATLVMDEVAFRNVVVNGLILDDKGEKMSKSRNNSVDPFAVVSTHGADVVRWYMLSNSPPWDSMKFSERGLTETRGRFFGTIENVYKFMASYANIDGFTFAETVVPVAERSELDQWILSRLNSTAHVVDRAFEAYDCTRAARAMEQFVDELSNWYIRRSRYRFWAGKKATDQTVAVSDEGKINAYQTTFECLFGLAIMMSPIAPFFGDWLYRRLNEVGERVPYGSVHLANFPAADIQLVRDDLEHQMGLARRIVQLVLLLRNRSKINVRQPLARLLLVTGTKMEQTAVERVKDLILEEVNVKEIEYVADSNGVVRRSAKADYKKLGPRLGKQMKSAATAIASFDDDDIGRLLETGSTRVQTSEGVVEIAANEIEISSEAIGKWSVAQEGALTVALDTRIDDALRSQGYAREVVNRIQSLRKARDFELTDRIRVEYHASAELREAIQEHIEFIRTETLATEFDYFESPEGERLDRFAIGDEQFVVGVALTAIQLVT
ncbi:MAG: isoleucine--tRNA ligase [Pseudomonadota bacterium]|nr:isoleucine--tRNA ligase [Pseudomonadota bacterium]